MRDDTIANSRMLTMGGLLVLAGFAAAFAILVWRDPLYYYYDDALFYLQIARSVARGHGPEFTAGIPTNGYHPFWMLWCAAVAALTDTRWHQLVATAWLVVALNIAWMIAAWRVYSRSFAAPLVLAGIAFGAGYVFFYSFGMESPLALLCFTGFIGAALAHGRAPSRRLLVASALLAGMTVFARLDQAVTLAPVALWLGWRDWRARRDMAGLSLAAIAGAILPACWLLYNKLVFGAFTPISGMLKMSSAQGGVLPPASGVVYLYLAIALAAAATSWWRREAAARGVVIAAAIGHLLYLGYLTAGGNRETYGWYFALLAGSMGLFVPALASNVLARLPQRLRSDGLAGAGIALVLAVGIFLFHRGTQRPMGIELADYQGASSLGRLARTSGVGTVLTFDQPGVLAFLDGLNVVAADGLTTNLAFQQRLRRNGMDWLVKNQGIDGVVIPKVGARHGEEVCGQRFLESSMLICERLADGRVRAVESRYFSRLDGAGIGRIPLTPLRALEPAPARDVDLFVLDTPR